MSHDGLLTHVSLCVGGGRLILGLAGGLNWVWERYGESVPLPYRGPFKFALAMDVEMLLAIPPECRPLTRMGSANDVMTEQLIISAARIQFVVADGSSSPSYNLSTRKEGST